MENKNEPFIKKLVIDGFELYFKTYIIPLKKQYPNCQIHMLGLLAVGFKEYLIEVAKNNNLEIPELIYWNLSGKYNNFPIDESYENTSIVSGFSEQLLTVILNNDKINPLSLMDQILEPYYKNILI